MDLLIQKLKKNNIQGYWAQDISDAKKIALDLIPPGAVVGMGNSMTLRQTGIFQELTGGSYNVINQFEPGISPEENLNRRRISLTSDVYFSSSNMVTMDGALINVDGKGNRVAALMFGPHKVVLVVGKNKIVKDEDQAWERLRQHTAPTLAKKLGRSTPCVKTGTCSDCQSPQRICRYYTVINSQMPADIDRIHVIIVDGEWGI